MLILNDVLFWAGAILSVISAYRMCLSERKQGYKAVELHISPRAFRMKKGPEVEGALEQQRYDRPVVIRVPADDLFQLPLCPA